MVDLSKRLEAIAHLIQHDSCIADVGCDHGYISIWLILNEIANHVIAMDIKPGPLEIADKNVTLYGLKEKIELRLSDGLRKLAAREADGAVIAGMGGSLMVKIIQQDRDKLVTMKQLILQPQSEVQLVRRYLREIGWTIDQEDMVVEDGKYYPMFHAIPGADEELSNQAQQILFDYYGRQTLVEQHPVVKEFLQKELGIVETVIKKLDVQRRADYTMNAERKQIRLEELHNHKARIAAALEYYS
ncbi:MAG TPA: class I SAM-dependent methyltransferase [Lachnospiraceae bacterium]|jgi:tRNA (adenine22-N1)-methyltransferase|nr:class I SAM-dependent methyltransferase [Lachnospiraceae bacterium]